MVSSPFFFKAHKYAPRSLNDDPCEDAEKHLPQVHGKQANRVCLGHTFLCAVNKVFDAVKWVLRDDRIHLLWDGKEVGVVNGVRRFREFDSHMDAKAFVKNSLGTHYVYPATMEVMSAAAQCSMPVEAYEAFQQLPKDEQIRIYLESMKKREPTNEDMRLVGHLLQGVSVWVSASQWYGRV